MKRKASKPSKISNGGAKNNTGKSGSGETQSSLSEHRSSKSGRSGTAESTSVKDFVSANTPPERRTTGTAQEGDKVPVVQVRISDKSVAIGRKVTEDAVTQALAQTLSEDITQRSLTLVNVEHSSPQATKTASSNFLQPAVEQPEEATELETDDKDKETGIVDKTKLDEFNSADNLLGKKGDNIGQMEDGEVQNQEDGLGKTGDYGEQTVKGEVENEENVLAETDDNADQIKEDGVENEDNMLGDVGDNTGQTNEVEVENTVKTNENVDQRKEVDFEIVDNVFGETGYNPDQTKEVEVENADNVLDETHQQTTHETDSLDKATKFQQDEEKMKIVHKSLIVNETDQDNLDLESDPGRYTSDNGGKGGSLTSRASKRGSLDNSRRQSSFTGEVSKRDSTYSRRESDELAKTSRKKEETFKRVSPRDKRMSVQAEKPRRSFGGGRRLSMPIGKQVRLGQSGGTESVTPSVVVNHASQDGNALDVVQFKSRLISTPSLKEIAHSTSDFAHSGPEGGKSELFQRVPSKKELVAVREDKKNSFFITENYHDGELENLEELPDIAEYKRKQRAARKLKSAHSMDEESKHSVETITEDKEEKETETTEHVQKENTPLEKKISLVDRETSTDVLCAHTTTQTSITNNPGDKLEDNESPKHSKKRKVRKPQPHTYYTTNRLLGKKPKIKHFNVIQRCTAENIVETVETRLQLREDADEGQERPKIPLILDSEAFWRDDELNIVVKAKGNYGLQPLPTLRNDYLTLMPFAINITFIRHDSLPKRRTRIAHRELLKSRTRTHPSKWMRKFSPTRNDVIDSRAQGPEFITSFTGNRSQEFPSLPRVKGTASPPSPR